MNFPLKQCGRLRTSVVLIVGASFISGRKRSSEQGSCFFCFIGRVCTVSARISMTQITRKRVNLYIDVLISRSSNNFPRMGSCGFPLLETLIHSSFTRTVLTMIRALKSHFAVRQIKLDEPARAGTRNGGERETRTIKPS